MKHIALLLVSLLVLGGTGCNTRYTPTTAEEQRYDARIKDRIGSAQQMIEFRSATVVISEKIQKMEAEQAELSRDPLWKHYEKDYSDMITKLKSSLEARK